MPHQTQFLACPWDFVVALAFAGACGSDPAARDVGSADGAPTAGSSASAGSDGSGDGTGEGSGEGGTVDTADGSDSGGDTGNLGEGIAQAELVGQVVDGSPYFRAVDNFNDGDAVAVGIDPARFDLQGVTCDLYAVAAKAIEQWAVDPILEDLRPAGAQSVVLDGSLADNRFALTEAAALESDAGPGLGVPFDVVLDCNRNGELDAGDVIDGGREPGMYRTHDATLPGPLEIAVAEYSGGSFRSQRTFYPAAIAEMGALPLIVVTHGWSYTYEYYDYIGQHLASYGYVVMHHEANVQDGGPPGTITAANDTLANTDYLLANLGTIAGGALAGHIDPSRIMLTGHSTGGEAVVAALTQLRTGAFSSEHFGYEDIRIVSSMAPVSWHPREIADPGDVPYHMFVAGADDDVSGAPLLSYTQCRSIFERAQGDRQLTYVHGAGHGDLLDCCGELFLDESAPDLIGREETKRVARGYFLALAELYLRDNAAGREYFARPFSDYHPPAIADSVVVTGEYRQGRAGVVVLDDFEDSPGAQGDPLATSSAGTAVDFELPHGEEVLMRDNDGSLAWTGTQPSNGMTHARHEGDDPHALVFDFAGGGHAFYEVAVPAKASGREASDRISLRACQGTRHPETTALGGPLAFTISLRDAAGNDASIRVDGDHAIPTPYARAGEGAGVGWGNEFVTLRVALSDFLGANPNLDLATITAVRLDFGSDFGSARGRVGLDDIEFVAAGP